MALASIWGDTGLVKVVLVGDAKRQWDDPNPRSPLRECLPALWSAIERIHHEWRKAPGPVGSSWLQFVTLPEGTLLPPVRLDSPFRPQPADLPRSGMLALVLHIDAPDLILVLDLAIL